MSGWVNPFTSKNKAGGTELVSKKEEEGERARRAASPRRHLKVPFCTCPSHYAETFESGDTFSSAQTTLTSSLPPNSRLPRSFSSQASSR